MGQVQGKEEFLAIGAEGVKQLELPAKQRKLNMEALQDFKRVFFGRERGPDFANGVPC